MGNVKYPSDAVRVTPLLLSPTTAGVSTGELGNLVQRVRISGYHEKLSIVIAYRCGSASEASGINATAGGSIDFSVIEATAATSLGSAITGATMTLGSPKVGTDVVTQGALALSFGVATNLATTVNLNINGATYHSVAAGATARSGALRLEDALLGKATSTSYNLPGKVGHYTAVADAGAAGQVWLQNDDGDGSGIAATIATATPLAPRTLLLQGVIDLPVYKLSTNTPKYLGIAATANGAATVGIISAQLLTFPAGYGTPGKRVDCST